MVGPSFFVKVLGRSFQDWLGATNPGSFATRAGPAAQQPPVTQP